MKKVFVCFLIAVTAAALAPGAFAVGKDEKPRNIILIGWDGAQRNHVKECLDRGELPNIKKLSSEGALVAIDIFRVTDTKAGWSQILTGYEPEITGVFSNGKYQPIPKGYTVFERLEGYFFPEDFYTAAVIGKKAHVDADAPVKNPLKEKQLAKMPAKKKAEGKLVVEDGVTYFTVPGKPYYNASQGMDLFQNGLTKNENVGERTLELLGQNAGRPFFFFVHFAEIDSQGHKFGENSKESNDAYISDDLWTGKIMQKLKDLGIYDKTLVYVTADHGFDEGGLGHGDAPYVFLATNDPKVMRRGTRADITPTILDRFGVDLSKIQPPLDGRPLTKPYESLW